MRLIQKTSLIFITFIGCLIPSALTQQSGTFGKDGTNIPSENPHITPNKPLKGKSETVMPRIRNVRGARTLEGSIYEGLRSDYLLTITLPWTLGMLGSILLLLICMRTDGWLYHLFTDDYVPPSVKKRMEEEARRAQGNKARMEHADNWNETRRNWETDLRESTARVRSTMPRTAHGQFK